MKTLTLASLAFAASVTASPQQRGKTTGKTAAPKAGGKSSGAGGLGGLLGGLMSGGAPGSDPLGGIAGLLGGGGGSMIGSVITMVNSGYGTVAPPAGAVGRRQTLAPRVKLASGGKTSTIKIRYGPYKIPSVEHKNVLGEAGALYNFPHRNVDKPCAGDCMIVGINAGLEKPDGSNANVHNGLWLHHFVLLAAGPGRSDSTCVNNGGSLPHLLVGSTSKGSERIFSSGNERTPAFPHAWGSGKDAGIKLQTADSFHMIVDLMNTNAQDEIVWLTITYDLVDGHPANMDDIKPVWFDVAQCGTSEVIPKQQTGSWFIDSGSWTPNFDGEVIGAAGHLHDGGTSIQLIVDGKIVCDSAASYGGSPEFIGKGMGGGGGHHDSESGHISGMTLCITGTPSFNVTKLAKSQTWKLRALYDYNKYPGMSHGDGKQENVMGIAIMFVRRPKS